MDECNIQRLIDAIEPVNAEAARDMQQIADRNSEELEPLDLILEDAEPVSC